MVGTIPLWYYALFLFHCLQKLFIHHPLGNIFLEDTTLVIT